MSEQLDPDLTALEQSLGKLEPAATIARDQVMYRAGQAASGTRWPWPASTAASALAACVLGFLLWRQSTVSLPAEPPRVVYVERVITVPAAIDTPSNEPGPSASAPAPSSLEYLRMRQEVLYWGPEVLRSSPGGSASREPTLTPADAMSRPGAVSGWQDLLNIIPSGGGS